MNTLSTVSVYIKYCSIPICGEHFTLTYLLSKANSGRVPQTHVHFNVTVSHALDHYSTVYTKIKRLF